MKHFIIMGRYGDIIIALPALKHIYDTTGQKPVVITSTRFGDIFDGVSYVDAIQLQDLNGDNYLKAQDYCKEKGYKAKVLRWWMIGNAEDLNDIPLSDSDNTVIFKGKKFNINFTRWPNYQTSLWDRTGVPIELMKSLPLVFDKRNKERETALVNFINKKNKKRLPVCLYNFCGHSSPFAAVPEFMNELYKWKNKFHMVDLGELKCEKIYDLLGLFDASKLLVTIDTATMHLSKSSKIKTIAFANDSNNGWGQSMKHDGIIAYIKYMSASSNIKRFNTFVESAFNT
jgi:hypothetical protein